MLWLQVGTTITLLGAWIGMSLFHRTLGNVQKLLLLVRWFELLIPTFLYLIGSSLILLLLLFQIIMLIFCSSNEEKYIKEREQIHEKKV